MEDEIILEELDAGDEGGARLADHAANSACESATIEPAAELPPERQYCIFRAGRDRYCMSVLDVEEVVEWPKVTPVPLAPSFLVGIFNLRGAIVPIVDLAFGQGKRLDSMTRIVVGFLPQPESHGFVRVGIAADEVNGTFTTVEPLLTESIPIDKPHCSGLLRVGDSMALALDLKRVTELFPVPVI
jgi:purine-binding chemotaxis protein CheW